MVYLFCNLTEWKIFQGVSVMIIANPIYDTYFKLLLENNKIAKFFIGTILDCKVLTLEPSVVEHTKFDGDRLTLYRKDFAATIETSEGTKRVIIEMQKSLKPSDIGRFRGYLGGEYDKTNLPLIAIYILGFPLKVDSPAFATFPEARDLQTKEKLVIKDEFVEQLTHTSYFIQTTRIKQSWNNKLEKLLSLFEQDNFVGNDQTLKRVVFETDDPELKEILLLLEHAAADDETRKELEKELYYRKYVEQTFGETYAIIAQQADEITEKDEVIAHQADEIAVKEGVIAQQADEIAEKNKTLSQKEQEIAELKKLLKI